MVIHANQTDLKMEKLRENPVEIYVMRFSSETTPGPAYIESLGRGGVVMHDTWFEADWYDSAEDVDAQIAESARSVYSAERIRIKVDSAKGITVIEMLKLVPTVFVVMTLAGMLLFNS